MMVKFDILVIACNILYIFFGGGGSPAQQQEHIHNADKAVKGENLKLSQDVNM